ncbi:dihydroxyacetone kinase subunit DhaL [Lacrimispora indolis]|uniref:dihydroxyacetone kinase subunit DhaL n=1 Tax=Lacrimispora indolis TaxID=69825 RepID=UPI0004196323|nr:MULTISPECIES: dihydroxyacetone kinase subunit DhaL [Lachnospiraceae]
MGFELTGKDYAEYIKKAYDLIHENGEYVTELDLATGDGDHWSNINMGFEKLVEKADELGEMSISDELKEIGKIMMAVIGGSSGVLYGSAYLGAAKALKGREVLDCQGVCDMLEAMLEAIMSRGQAKEGFKTMIDSLSPAVNAYKKGISEGKGELEICEMVKRAAIDGAENTKNMEAVRGRATYQANKGLGHLDPGAVTMSYQIGTLMNCIKEKINI